MRRVWSARFVVPPTSNHSKVRNNARQENTQYRAAPGCQRDRGPFCFGKRPEEPLPRGSFGQLLRGGSTPRFFSQIRSVGSKPSGWQGTASQPLVPGPRVQPKSPRCGLAAKNLFSPLDTPTVSGFTIPVDPKNELHGGYRLAENRRFFQAVQNQRPHAPALRRDWAAAPGLRRPVHRLPLL